MIRARTARGLTLVELCVIIGVIGVLVVLTIPILRDHEADQPNVRAPEPCLVTAEGRRTTCCQADC